MFFKSKFLCDVVPYFKALVNVLKHKDKSRVMAVHLDFVILLEHFSLGNILILRNQKDRVGGKGKMIMLYMK